MPYTFAHIGYILPIRKKWSKYFSITGLVFGSLAPDYDILFRLTKIRFHVFQYNLKTICFLIYPMAFLSAVLFHLICRNVLIKNLPSPFFEKYQKYLSFDFNAYLKNHLLLFSASVFFAIFLHLFLDFFCHILDAYQVSLFVRGIIQMQYLSDKIGYFSIYFLPVVFSCLGFYYIYKFEYNSVIPKMYFSQPKQAFLFWITLLILTIFICALKIFFTEKEKDYWLDLIAISFTSALIIAVYLCCFIFYFRKENIILQ